jgi:hypothetical protein
VKKNFEVDVADDSRLNFENIASVWSANQSLLLIGYLPKEASSLNALTD